MRNFYSVLLIFYCWLFYADFKQTSFWKISVHILRLVNSVYILWVTSVNISWVTSVHTFNTLQITFVHILWVTSVNVSLLTSVYILWATDVSWIFHVFIYEWPFLRLLFAVVVTEWCFMIFVNVCWVHLAPQNIPSKTVLIPGHKVVLYCIGNFSSHFMGKFSPHRMSNFTSYAKISLPIVQENFSPRFIGVFRPHPTCSFSAQRVLFSERPALITGQ